MNSVDLKGQLIPGVSMVSDYQIDDNLPLPIITFPGNLGDKYSLFKVWQIMDS